MIVFRRNEGDAGGGFAPFAGLEVLGVPSIGLSKGRGTIFVHTI